MIKVKIGKVKYEIFGNRLFKNGTFLKSASLSVLKFYLHYRYKRYLYHYNSKLPRMIAKIIGQPYMPQLPILDIGFLLCQN